MKTFSEEYIDNYIKKLVSEQESLIAKYLSETGYKITDICLVEHQTANGRIFYPDLKSKYSLEALNEP